MIRILKPGQAPAVLRDRGSRAIRELCQAYDAASDDYLSGARTFTDDLDSSIYADPSVKATLRTAQHDKCAFCESTFAHVGFGDIEHFRPKAGYKQKETNALGRPGYYWLAYDWDNRICGHESGVSAVSRQERPFSTWRRLSADHDD